VSRVHDCSRSSFSESSSCTMCSTHSRSDMKSPVSGMRCTQFQRPQSRRRLGITAQGVGHTLCPAGPPRPLIVHARKYRPASVYILSDYGKYSKLYKCTTFRKTADISYFTANKQVREGKGPGKTQKICPLDCPWWIWARETKTEKKDGGLGHISSLR